MELQAAFDHGFQAVKAYVDRSFAAQDKKIETLERMITQLQRELAERKSLAYLGPWRAGMICVEGDFVTDHGGLWHCNRETALRPGDSPDWTLAVKRGHGG